MAGVLGVLYYEFRFLDRNQPCRNTDLRDFAACECDMAEAGHPMRRSHYGIRTNDRRSIPHHPSWPPLAVLLADSLPERKTHLAEPAFAIGVGFLRDLDVSDRQHALPAPADYSR